MGAPLAYFLTWTGYGQRLHGDPRGSVDRKHNLRGTPYLTPDPVRQRASLARMKQPKVWILPAWRPAVDRGIVELCEHRGWRLITRNVRTTHVHVIANCRGEDSPERALAAFKARATRDLVVAGLVQPVPEPLLWADHGSTRWLNHEPGLYGAIAYVNDWQTGPNREILEERKRLLKEHIRSLRAWLKRQGLPEDGKAVVLGETEEERRKRLTPEHAGDVHYEPGTK